MATWRYKLEHEFRYYSKSLAGVTFKNEWVEIRNNMILIQKDYAWDGCSPSYYIKPIKFWAGVPDGFKGVGGHPPSYWASLVHDALCQFREEIFISKKGTVDLFREMLKNGGAPLWMTAIYPTAVDYFGPQRWLGYLRPQ